MADAGVLRPRRTSLRGRHTECAVLDAVVAAVREGKCQTLVVRGEAGIGKTALLEYLVEAASDLRVVRLVGVESEMELAFGALHQLCAPMFDRLPRLPGPQREALEIVFGLGAGPTPDRFLVGLAVLCLLSEVAEKRPVICVVDDAQWLDRASVQTLAFAARRLWAKPVGLVFSTREPGEDLRGLPELEVRGLVNGDARALLGSVIRNALDERVRDRIVAETRGNPLALLELPRGPSATRLAGGFELLDAPAVSGSTEASFRQRFSELPSETQRLLLVAAAEPVGDPQLVWRAAERLSIKVSAVAAAEAEGLLLIREQVVFCHPLVRSAVYRSATVEDRRSAHLALAEVTDPQVDCDRRAWHLAAATPGPDEEVASEIERCAGCAQARGGLSSAAAFLQRAVTLTPDATRRAERALAAAQASLRAGGFDAAHGLLATAEACPLDELQRARIDLLRGQIAFSSGLGCNALPLLVKAARRLERLDLELARESYLYAWGAAAFVERPGAGPLLAVCRAARALPPATEPTRPADLLLDGLSLLITESRAAAAPALRRAADAFARDDVPIADCLGSGWLATVASFAIWDDDATRAVCARQIALVRRDGALEGLPLYLAALGITTAWSGDFAAAASLVAEIHEVTAATGARIPPVAAMLVLSLKGREAEASALVSATVTQAGGGNGTAVAAAQWTGAVLYNGLGRYEDALAAAQQASSDPLDLYPSMWALSELIEAAVHCGQADPARIALERLAATTEPAGTDFGLGIEARSRALVCEGEAAEVLYREAIDRLGRTRLRPELARAHLLYGEWLRRESRRVDAREQLRTAYDTLIELGMEAFAERARRELQATGEKVRKRSAETRDQLTRQEAQIAWLARDGLTNPEIGTRLFLSPRTVEWHLRKVFSKLGVSSRKELRGALRSSETELIVA
jgi:DNA-binding CsgD family transcriptional regulator